MPIRRPFVAGRFYPGDARALRQMVRDCLPASAPADSPRIVMAPHAGYIFSGPTAGAALAGVTLPKTLIVLCPNHTGLGHALGVWADGAWETPLGSVPVDSGTAARLLARGLYGQDTRSHLREHSIEVLLPFLQVLGGDKVPAIVPVCLGTQDQRALEAAGAILAGVVGQGLIDGSVGILVSSDMNHYESETVTRKKDELALQCVLDQDPKLLLDRCRADHITMCGCGPMALALHCLHFVRRGQAPSAPARVLAHTTSGKAASDYEHVVGYAAVRVYL